MSSSLAGVAVVCDTTSYLPPEMLRHGGGIELIDLYVGFEGERQREGEITDYDEFYERLRASQDVPSTSQPSVGDFLTVFRSSLEAGRDVAAAMISSGVSGTYQSAIQARDELISEGVDEERIGIFDSETCAGGLGLVAMAGAAAAGGGADVRGVLDRMQEARNSLKIWFAVDTLEYLRRNGRIGAASAWVGSTLQIKPILTLEREITPVERVRTRRRAFDRLLDYAKQRKESGADAWVVQHIQAEADALRLIERCREVFGSDPVFVSEVGPVIGAHVGPGLLGVGGLPASLLE